MGIPRGPAARERLAAYVCIQLSSRGQSHLDPPYFTTVTLGMLPRDWLYGHLHNEQVHLIKWPPSERVTFIAWRKRPTVVLQICGHIRATYSSCGAAA